MIQKFQYFLALLLATTPVFAKDSSPIEHYVMQHVQAGQPDAAEKFLKTLEEMNSPEGLFWLGQYYLEGYNGTKDSGTATQYFQRSAALGFVPALNAVADSYLIGDGIDKNPVKALEYYEAAAQKGYGPAQFNAGVLCKNGIEVPKDLNKARTYLDSASKNEELGALREDAAAMLKEIASAP